MKRLTVEEANDLFQRQREANRSDIYGEVVPPSADAIATTGPITPGQIVYAYTGGNKPPRPVVPIRIFFGVAAEVSSVEQWYMEVTYMYDQTSGFIPLSGSVFSKVV